MNNRNRKLAFSLFSLLVFVTLTGLPTNYISIVKDDFIQSRISIDSNVNSQKFLFKLNHSYQCQIQINRLNRNQERMFKAKHTLTKAIVLALIAMVLQAEIIAPAGLHKLSLTGGHSNQITVKKTTTRSQSYPDTTAHDHDGIDWDGPSEQVDLRMNFRFDRTLKHFRVENMYQLEEEEQEPEVQTLTSVSKKVNVVTKTIESPTITTSHYQTTSTFEQLPEKITVEPEWSGEEEKNINNVVLTATKQMEDKKVKADRQEGSQAVEKSLLTWGKESLKADQPEEKDQREKLEKVEDKGSIANWKSTLFISANPVQKSTQSPKDNEVQIVKPEIKQDKKQDKKEDKKEEKNENKKEDKKEEKAEENKEEKKERKEKPQKVSEKSEESASNKSAEEWMNEDSSKIKWFGIKSSKNSELKENKKKESEGSSQNESKSEDHTENLKRTNFFKQIHEHKTQEEQNQKEEGKTQPEQPITPIQPTIPSIPDVAPAPIAPADVITASVVAPESPIIIPAQIPEESTPQITPPTPSTEVIPVVSPPEAQAPVILPNSQLPAPTTPTESTQPIIPTSPATPSESSNPITSDSVQSPAASTAPAPSTDSQNSTPASTTDTSILQSTETSSPASTSETSTTSTSEPIATPSAEPLAPTPSTEPSVPSTEASTPASSSETSTSTISQPAPSSETSSPSIPETSVLPVQSPSSTPTIPDSEPTSTSIADLGGDSGSQIISELGGDIGSVSPSTPDLNTISEDWTR